MPEAAGWQSAVLNVGKHWLTARRTDAALPAFGGVA